MVFSVYTELCVPSGVEALALLFSNLISRRLMILLVGISYVRFSMPKDMVLVLCIVCWNLLLVGILLWQ